MKKLIVLSVALLSLALLAFATATIQDMRYTGNVTTVEDSSSEPLDRLMNSQANQAFSRGESSVWVGYRLKVRPSMRYSYINSDFAEGHHNIHISSHSRNDKDRYGVERVGSELKNLLFLYKKGSGRNPVRISMIDSDSKLKFNKPLIWINGVSTQRSLTAMMSMAAKPANEKLLRHGLMALVAAHPGDEPQKYFLNKVRSNSSVKVRKNGIFWYGYTLDGDDLGELPRLERELKETDLRKQIAFVYHNIESKAAFDRLMRMAENETDREVKESAIFWIGQSDDFNPVPALKRIYAKATTFEIRKKIVFSASQVENEESLAFLKTVALTDKSNEMRAQAIFWIGQTEEEEALPILREMYAKATSQTVKEKIVFSASQLDTREALEFIVSVAKGDKSQTMRQKAIFWIGQSDDEELALKYLKEIYGSGLSRTSREKVLFSASQVDSSEALNFLLKVAREDSERELRHKAIFWVGQSDSESRALESLKSIYKSESITETRKKVIFSISQLDSDDAARFLLQIAKTETNEELRKQAVFWLTQSDSDLVNDYFESVIES